MRQQLKLLYELCDNHKELQCCASISTDWIPLTRPVKVPRETVIRHYEYKNNDKEIIWNDNLKIIGINLCDRSAILNEPINDHNFQIESVPLSSFPTPILCNILHENLNVSIYKYVQKLNEHKHLIINKVQQVLEKLDYQQLRDLIDNWEFKRYSQTFGIVLKHLYDPIKLW